MEDSKKIKYCPCFRCKNKLNSNIMATEIKLDQYKQFFKDFKNKKKFVVGAHGNIKSMAKNIDLTNDKEKNLATDGEIIEIQQGKKFGEIKFIVYNKRGNEPMHYVFLKDKLSKEPILINVYNPKEGMDFKWSKDGKQRIYLNKFRDCCPHPMDKKENYFKEHHGKNHELYEYQKKALKEIAAGDKEASASIWIERTKKGDKPFL